MATFKQPLGNRFTNPLRVIGQAAVMLFISRSERLSVKFITIAEILDYRKWLEATFGDIRMRTRREAVWADMHQSLGNSRFHGIEFGVAWGYLTNWWISRYSSTLIAWDGFDRFTGLPRKWRNLPSGSFDAGGNTPKINDNRLTWHIGNLEATIDELKIIRDRDYAIFIFFDLDIFEPSLVGWEKMCGHLIAGDILYFDEAMDADERRLLNEFVLPSGRFEFVSANWASLAIKVVVMF